MSAKYLLPCPCGEKIVVGLPQAGSSVVCRCGQSLVVPASDEIVRLEPVEVLAKEGRKLVHAWGRREGCIFLGAFLTVVSLLLLGFLYLTWPRLRPIDELSPVASYQLWLQLQRGVNRYPSNMERNFARLVVMYRYWMILGYCALGAGLLLTLSAFIFFRPTRVRAEELKRVRRAPRAPPARAQESSQPPEPPQTPSET